MAEIRKLSLLVAFLWVCANTRIHQLSALPTPTTLSPPPSPPLLTEIEEIDCKNDLHCEPEQFCNFATHSCADCLDCGKFHLEPGRSECSKRKEECGVCEPGYKMDEGEHCSPVEKPGTFVPTEADTTSSRGLDWTVVGIFVLFVAAISIAGLVSFCVCKCKRNANKSRQPASEPPHEMKSLIGQGQSVHSNDDQCPSSTSASAPPENLLASGVNPHPYVKTVWSNPAYTNQTVFTQENGKEKAEPFDTGNFSSNWRLDDDALFGGTQVDGPSPPPHQDQSVPDNDSAVDNSEPEPADQHVENMDVEDPDLMLANAIAAAGEFPPEFGPTPPLPNLVRTFVPRVSAPRNRTRRPRPRRVGRQGPFPVVGSHEDVSSVLSPAARSSLTNRFRRASGPSHVRREESTSDFSSLVSTSDVSSGPSTSSLGHQPPSQTQSAVATRVPTRNNSGDFPGDSGHSSTPGLNQLHGGMAMDALSLRLGLTFCGGCLTGTSWIPQPPPENRDPTYDYTLQFGISEVSHADLSGYLDQDQNLEAPGEEVAEDGAEVPGDVDPEEMDVDDDHDQDQPQSQPHQPQK